MSGAFNSALSLPARDQFQVPEFPEIVDSSMRSSLVACPRMFYYSHILNLRKSAERSIHLVFGGAFARGLEVARKAFWQEELDEINAISKAIKATIIAWGDYEIPDDIAGSRAGVKSLSALIDALCSYFEHHQLGNDVIRPLFVKGEAMIEKSFALPIPGTSHPVTGAPIICAGRFDLLGVFQDAIFVVDEKTTTALGQRWRSNWTLRGQLSAYCWGGRLFLHDENIAGCIIRGVGVLSQTINFEQAIVSRPEWQVDSYIRQLALDVNRACDWWMEMRDRLERGEEHPELAYDQALDSACSAYSGCGYAELCDSPDPKRWYSNYVVKKWNPLERESDE